MLWTDSLPPCQKKNPYLSLILMLQNMTLQNVA